MNVGVISLDFEVGFPIDGGVYGSGFSGRAEIDCDGKVVHLALESYSVGKDGEFDVPPVYDPTSPISLLADAVEGIYEDEIEDKLNDWAVSLAEQQWEPREAAE